MLFYIYLPNFNFIGHLGGYLGAQAGPLVLVRGFRCFFIPLVSNATSAIRCAVHVAVLVIYTGIWTWVDGGGRSIYWQLCAYYSILTKRYEKTLFLGIF